MPLSLRIMEWLGVVSAVIGLPLLLAPERVRTSFGWAPTPQLSYILRLCGTMFAAMGLILIMFANVYWRAIR